LVGCETDRPSSGSTSAAITSLAQSVAKRLYDSGNGTINAEVTAHKQLFQSLYFFIKINQWIPQHFTVAFNRFSFLSNFPFISIPTIIYILSDALYTFREIRENDLSSCASEIERLKLDFDKYLRENQDSEISSAT
jgi:hypothetical protein